MHAYIKDGRLDSFSEEFFPKPVSATEAEPEIPGLVYDEAIEYDFEEIPVFEDGKIVPYSKSRKKAKDDAEAERKRSESAKLRKTEILSEAGRLDFERSGLLALGGSNDDPEISEIAAKIAALRTEYESLNA